MPVTLFAQLLYQLKASSYHQFQRNENTSEKLLIYANFLLELGIWAELLFH